MVIRYPKEEKKNVINQTFQQRKDSLLLPCWNIVALTPDSFLLQSPHLKSEAGSSL